MNVERFEISGPLLFSPDIYRDERGDFLETFSLKQFEIHVPDVEFVQDNQSSKTQQVCITLATIIIAIVAPVALSSLKIRVS